MTQAAFSALQAWGRVTDQGKAQAAAADDEREQRVELAIRATIANCGQAVTLLTARRDYGRLLRLSNALNEIVARALGAIPEDGGQ